MPQLDSFIFSSIAIYTIIIFLVLLFLMHTYLLPKVKRQIVARKKILSISFISITPEDIIILAFFLILIKSIRNYRVNIGNIFSSLRENMYKKLFNCFSSSINDIKLLINNNIKNSKKEKTFVISIKSWH